MPPDPIVEEIRRIRDEYAASFDYDLAEICRDLRESQKRGGRKVVSFVERPAPVPASAENMPANAGEEASTVN